MNADIYYMQRCIRLALNGKPFAHPNPMVGAVIVVGDRIIGEGYHQHCGGPHAEVNAFASVASESERLLPEATLYVSLEPCSHYGKTPPCADLIIRKGVKRVVVGTVDFFSKVSGRGIRKLMDAGIEVTVGVMEDECRELNRAFFTYHLHHRPFVTLKWAQTENGFIDDHHRPLTISSPFTRMLVHHLRADNDAILVGHTTDEREHPRLDVRHWSGDNPKRIVLQGDTTLPLLLDNLYRDGIQTLLVEGGAQTHRSFLDARLCDELRIETAPFSVDDGTPAAPVPADFIRVSHEVVDRHTIDIYRPSAGKSFND